MSRLYDPDRKVPLQAPVDLPQPVSERFRGWERYIPSDGLVRAVNVALWLGQPLLLTGDPGTGKTQLAYHVARNLGLPDPIRFDVKSSSESRDLFYSYDGLREFRESRSVAQGVDSSHYVTLQALGLAILMACAPAERRRLPQSAFPPRFQKAVVEAAAPSRSVVLIDEIDKAPRDVPNDLLNEIEHNRFWMPELRIQFEAPADQRPVIILTSNSERGLPDAFLRRCTYFHIEFPEPGQFRRIIAGHLSAEGLHEKALLVENVTRFVDGLRTTPEPLRKKPGLSEALAWLVALRRTGVTPDDAILGKEGKKEAFELTLPALIKNQEDREAAMRLRDELPATPADAARADG